MLVCRYLGCWRYQFTYTKVNLLIHTRREDNSVIIRVDVTYHQGRSGTPKSTGKISILYCIMICDKISWQILDIVISRYGVFVVFSWLKRLHYSKVMWFFWTYQTVLIVLILTLYPLHYWWLFVKKCHWVTILWNNQLSSLQCCLSVKICGKKYCDFHSFYHLSCSNPLEYASLRAPASKWGGNQFLENRKIFTN